MIATSRKGVFLTKGVRLGSVFHVVDDIVYIEFRNHSSCWLVDKKDFIDFELDQYSWILNSDGYARTSIFQKDVLAHRFLVGAVKGQTVDHINGDKLDNRRENLRIVTVQQNTHNRGLVKSNKVGFRGVCYCPTKKKPYRASLKHAGKHVLSRFFSTPEEAFACRVEAEKKYYGEHRRVN